VSLLYIFLTIIGINKIKIKKNNQTSDLLVDFHEKYCTAKSQTFLNKYLSYCKINIMKGFTN